MSIIVVLFLVGLSLLLGSKVFGYKALATDAGNNKKIRLLRTKSEVDNVLYKRDESIIKGAKQFLITSGSRGSNSDYFDAASERFRKSTDLELYRILYGPPRHPELHAHLTELLATNSAVAKKKRENRLYVAELSLGGHIPEYHVCISESEAFIALPSPNKLESFDCGLHIKDAGLANSFAAQFKNMHNGQLAKLVDNASALSPHLAGARSTQPLGAG